MKNKKENQEIDIAISELTKLAKYLSLNFQFEEEKDTGAVDWAIRLLNKFKNQGI